MDIQDIFTHEVRGSFPSSTQTHFNVSINRRNELIDPCCYIEAEFETIISTYILDTLVKDYIGENLKLKPYPLANVTNSSNVVINGKSHRCEPCKFIQVLTYPNPNTFPESAKSDTPNIAILETPELIPAVKQSKIVPPGLTELVLVKNPQLTPVDIINTHNEWRFRFKLREPIIHPILNMNKSLKRTLLPHITWMNIDLSLNNLNGMFTFDRSLFRNITSISTEINSATLFQRRVLVNPELIPPVCKIVYEDIDCRSANGNGKGNKELFLGKTCNIPKSTEKFYISILDNDTHQYLNLARVIISIRDKHNKLIIGLDENNLGPFLKWDKIPQNAASCDISCRCINTDNSSKITLHIMKISLGKLLLTNDTREVDSTLTKINTTKISDKDGIQIYKTFNDKGEILSLSISD